LANGNKRHRADRQNMQSLSICTKASMMVWGSITTHHTYLAVTALGNGHCRTTANDSRQFQVRRGSGWVLHQVAWSETRRYHHFSHYQKILFSANHLQVWHA
jgi:hypothetical protein